MTLDSQVYAECFRDEPSGHALYTVVSGANMKPGTCGYFDWNHSWVPIAHLLDQHGTRSISAIEIENVNVDIYAGHEWLGTKMSAGVRQLRVKAKANSSIPGAVSGGLAAAYTTQRSQGALLVCGSNVTERTAYPAEPIRDFMTDNMQNVLASPKCDLKTVQKKGFWVITKTFTATRRGVALLRSAGSRVSAGLAVDASGIANGQVSARFWTNSFSNSGWLLATDQQDGIVLFAQGIYYEPKLLSAGFVEKEKRAKQSWLSGENEVSPVDVDLTAFGLDKEGAEYLRLTPRRWGHADGLEMLRDCTDS